MGLIRTMRLFKVFRVLFRSTFQCMEASVLNVWRPVIYSKLATGLHMMP